MINNTMEQPILTATEDKEIAFYEGASSDGQTLPLPREDGSILGKFATVQELSKAYENLQAEFTRKSQALADLTAAAKKPPEINDAQTDNTPSPVSVTQKSAVERSDVQLSVEDVIKQYLLSIAASKTAPTVINKPNNDFAFMKKQGTPSLGETSKLAEHFFQTKGN